MMRGPITATLSAIATIAAATFTAANANDVQHPDTTRWRCERCPFVTGFRGDAAVKSSYVNEAEARFGNFTGYDDNGAYLNASGSAEWASHTNQLMLDFANLGLDSRQLQLRGSTSGRFRYSAAYRERPWRRFDSTRTVFVGGENGALSLPGDWQTAATTAGFTGVEPNLQPISIESDRQEFRLGGDYRLSPQVEIYSHLRHEERDGTLISAAANFTQAAQLPRPIEFQTDEWTTGIRYRGKRAGLQMGYTGAQFDNRNGALRWENPFSAPLGADVGATSEAPDNTAHTLSFAGQFRGGHHTVANFNGTLSRMEQNEPFLPTTLNPNIATGPLPRTHLAGRVDRAHWVASLSTRLFGLARLRVSLSDTERDNRTPVAEWERVIVDSFASGEPESNQAYDFARRRLKLRIDATAIRDVRVSGGYTFTETKRNIQEVAEQEEHDSWGQLRWRPAVPVELSVKAGTAKREIGDYATSTAADLGQNPLLRKFNLAHRFREYAELTLTGTLPNLPVTFSVNAALTDDDYSKSVLGLTDSEEQRWHLDANWSASKKTTFYLNVGKRNLESQQYGGQDTSPEHWRADHDDTFTSIGGGLRIKNVLQQLDVSADLQRSRGATAIGIAVGSSTGRPLPELETDELTLRIKANYRYSARLRVFAELFYAQLETNDWALTGVAATTLPTLLSLGAQNYDYDVVRITAGARYRFGD